jgi:hypothetical protein
MLRSHAESILREFQNEINAMGYENSRRKTAFAQMLADLPYAFHQPIGGIIPQENFEHITEARALLATLQNDRLTVAVNYGSDTIAGILTRTWRLVLFLPEKAPAPTNVRTFTVPAPHYAPY